ncbi:FixH family protein [Castellaniella sp.]|uniref:FixH family protein n=1 Tax=Castellaniella sp. TaxID=1955812 RepID=UPI002AFF976E|nr:FixH family protein [Castellaniella sp.]
MPSVTHEQLSEGRPWWRHRWPWFLLLGPAVAVVGCVITIVLAVQSYGDQEIQDGGQRQGLVVTPPPPAQTGQ